MLSRMSPRTADLGVRNALVDAAARLLAEEGPAALTTRRLAEVVGTSTTAVYTHFRGMRELRRALRVEGFDRFAAILAAVEVRDDPVEELAELSAAYLVNAAKNPHLYRFMFMERPADEDSDVGLHTFERLVDATERAIRAGRFRKEKPHRLATQMWVSAHGVMTLNLSGVLTLDQAADLVRDTSLTLFIGFGDDPAAARKSLARGRRRAPQPGPTERS